ncbi:hypothetical protein BH10ACI1_BH10ACI1_08760 [soil metagenome]
MNLSTYIKIQKTLLAAFFISAAALIISLPIVWQNSGNVTPTNNTNGSNVVATNGNNNSPNAPETPNGGNYGLMIIGGVSFLTSLCSLVGFVSTTVLAWRKEKRDVEIIRIDNEKKELELAKLKFELDKLKSAEKKPKPKPRKPKKTE